MKNQTDPNVWGKTKMRNEKKHSTATIFSKEKKYIGRDEIMHKT